MNNNSNKYIIERKILKETFKVTAILAAIFLASCVSQKKYDMALEDIAKLKVQNDLQSYDKANVKFDKNQVISDQYKVISEKSNKLDSLNERLAIQREKFAKSKAILAALSTEESIAIGNSQEIEDKFFITLQDEILFSSGQFTISKDGKNSIKALSKMILSLDYEAEVWIVGHTDNEVFVNQDGKGNWRLSLDRSLAVTSELIKNGVSSDMLTAAGRGKNAPQSTNKTSSGKAENRRTEIIIVPAVSIFNSVYSSK